jgi:hypothetical protein
LRAVASPGARLDSRPVDQEHDTPREVGLWLFAAVVS